MAVTQVVGPLAFDPVDPIDWRTGTTTHGPARIPVYPVDTTAVGDQVRDLRLGRAMALRYAAKLAGLTARQLSDIEWGRVRVRDTRAALLELCRVWGVTGETTPATPA